MKAMLRWRYKCDHCGKLGGSKHHMVKHELGCTANPDRVCRMCNYAHAVQQSYDDLRAALLPQGGEPDLAALRTAASHCPACIFATIRRALPIDPEDGPRVAFNMREELREFWDEVNASRDEYS